MLQSGHVGDSTRIYSLTIMLLRMYDLRNGTDLAFHKIRYPPCDKQHVHGVTELVYGVWADLSGELLSAEIPVLVK